MQSDLPQDDFDSSDLMRRADKLRVNFPDDQVKLLRIQAKTDLFFLGNTILGFPDMSINLHGDLCNWLMKWKSWRYKLELLPRGHLKTSVITIAGGIQIVLPDDTSNQPFPYNLGTNARVLLGHEVIGSASDNLKLIKDKILQQEFIAALFPEIIPDRRLHKINTEQLELPRTAQYPESTFSIMGIGSAGQGKHFDHMKLDDMVGLSAMNSIASFDSAIDWIKDIPGMFTRMNATSVDFTGVRYGMKDFYNFLIEYYGDKLKIYTRSIYERDVNNNKVLIFPERVGWDDIELLKRDMKKFNSQYMNNPMDIEGEFDQAWERYYEWIDDTTILVTTGLPGFELREKIDIRDLDKLMFLDPAMTGASGIIVTGTDRKGNVYILHAEQPSYTYDKLTNRIFQLAEIWKPRAVVIEFVLFSGLYENAWKLEQRARNQYFRIIGARTKQKQKEDRVRVLRKWFANGQIYFHKKFDDLISQYRFFGSIKEYHMLDALAYGPEYWRASQGNEESETRILSINKMLEQRSKVTGYSRMYG